MEDKYSFCERATAGPLSPWHIRRLYTGRKLGGGADSDALCGQKVAWDLSVSITSHHLGHSCVECVRLFSAATDCK